MNHTSNAKSNRTFKITYIVSSIVTQFYQKFFHNLNKLRNHIYQKLKHLFMKMKVELHLSIIPF